jgi:FAD:protein FMN transferase
MNTDVEVLIDARPSPAVERLCDLAESEFSRYEQTFSRFREDSELSRLNQTGRVQPSPQLAEVIRLALAARDRTRGRFDPTVHDALVAAGYDRSFEHVGRTGGPGVATTVARCGGEVVIDTVSGAITLGYGVRLDLGGIAKGYAVDRVAELAGAHASCMVNAGGDVAVCGPPSCGAWDIGVTRGDGSVMTLSLSRGGLATSGRDRRRWTVDSREAHHIIDPVTSAPAQTDLLRVTAVASSAVDAEVLAKSLFICGRTEATRQANEAGVPCVLVDEKGETVLAGGLA